MPQETETKNVKCPKCGKDAKEITTKQIDLVDFGNGPTVSVRPIKKEVKCNHCYLDLGNIEEKYQDDD